MAKQSIIDYNRAFEKHLSQLNPAQAEAVKTIEGPMMVIAGPGTGKTHILTARIGQILKNTDTLAQNILCLTFTDAGVYAMKERLLKLIGPEAHRVHIYTFHSFCNTVIQENMSFFGRHELEPLSDLERVELIRKLIDDLPEDHLLKQRTKDVYYYEHHLNTLFQQMKMENWTYPLLKEKVEDYLENIANHPDFIYKRKTKEFKKGDLKQWKYDEEERKMKELLAGGALFDNYVELVKMHRRYDFNDMILWVLEAFREHEALLRNYQERYLYFLVDEYQDTNGAQNQILQTLVSYWDSPNVFIVGDDDQSIFEFQGARLKNLLDFHNQYQQDLKLVMLKENYRSSQKILDSAFHVIEQNENRIINNIEHLEKKLIAQNASVASSPIEPEVLIYENRAQEEASIVGEIEELYKKGVALEEVAIIYARHQQVRNIIALLEKKGIAYQTKKQVNILDEPLILNLRLLLQYINMEYHKPYSGEPFLYQILSFEFGIVDYKDLVKMSFFMAKEGKGIFWRDLISESSKLKILGLSFPEKVIAFSELLENLISQYRSYPLIVLLEKIINESGLLSYVIQQPDKVWQLQLVTSFFDFVRKEADRNPRINLNDLMRLLGNIDANRLTIPIQKTIYAQKGVNLVTAHSSKGLEFEYVYIVDGVKDYWEPAKKVNAKRFRLPDTLSLSGETDALESRRRLFYVAMTRAKEHLKISYARKNNQGKSLERTCFIDEIVEHYGLAPQEIVANQQAMLDAQILLLLANEKPRLPEEEESMVNGLLEGFALSVTSLNSFLRCPLSFYYEYVLRIPSVQSEAASYGIAMHYALSKIFEEREAREMKEFLPIEDTIFYFKAEMERQRGYFEEASYERRLSMGVKHLKLYYEEYVDTWMNKTLVEYLITKTEVGGVPVVGTIDRIDFLPKTSSVHIVDYKTGKPSSNRFSKFTASNPNGGLYRRQLIFYKLLFEAHQNTHFAAKGAISYFEPDQDLKFTTKTVSYEPKEVEHVKELVVNSYKRIMNHEFYEGCGEQNCKWCNFVKNNEVVSSFNDEEAEALDD